MSREVAQGVVVRQKVLLEIWSLGYFYVPSEWLTKTYKLGPEPLNLWRNRGVISQKSSFGPFVCFYHNLFSTEAFSTISRSKIDKVDFPKNLKIFSREFCTQKIPQKIWVRGGSLRVFFKKYILNIFFS